MALSLATACASTTKPGTVPTGTSAAQPSITRGSSGEVKLPYTVVAGTTPTDPAGTFAATSLPALISLLTAAGNRPPVCFTDSTCFAGVNPPRDSLLVLFSPAGACRQPTGYTVKLAGADKLSITTHAKHVCKANGGDASSQIPDALLAIPLKSLPTGVTLTITTSGPLTGTETTTIHLGA